MGFYIFFDYIVSFIILLAIHAPWWAWLIYVGSALFWFVVWALFSDGVGSGTTDKQKDKQS